MIEKSFRRAAWGFVVVAIAVLGACAPTVIFEEDTTTGPRGEGGEGGGGLSGAGGSLQPPPGEECPVTCDSVPGATCSCKKGCTAGALTILCEPITTVQNEQKTLCICTIPEVFSGACYEKNPANVCDFEAGCCAKYFSGK